VRNGRRYIAEEPLFPQYIFIHLDCVNDNWHPIRSTRGVHQIVRFNTDPLPIRDEVIEGIHTRLGDHPIKELYLRPGERVRIVEGAFSRLEAIFVADDGNDRVVLLLSLLQQEQRLVFPLKSIRRLA
jgi:transcriptional antiterminator RfaH